MEITKLLSDLGGGGWNELKADGGGWNGGGGGSWNELKTEGGGWNGGGGGGGGMNGPGPEGIDSSDGRGERLLLLLLLLLLLFFLGSVTPFNLFNRFWIT